MAIGEVTVSGGRNMRRSFLDPILAPLVGDGPDAPQTVGEVMGALQSVSSKLSSLGQYSTSRCSISPA